MKLALLNLVALIGSTAYANEDETRPALRGDAANVDSHNTLPEGYLKKKNLGSFKIDRPDEEEHDESQSYHGDEKLDAPDTLPVVSFKLKNNKIKNKSSSGGSEGLKETILENFEKTATDQDAEEEYEKKVTLNNGTPLCNRMHARCLSDNYPETTCATVYSFCILEIASDKFTFQDKGDCLDMSDQAYPSVEYQVEYLYVDWCKATCWSIDGVHGTVVGIGIGEPNTNAANYCFCYFDSLNTYTCPDGDAICHFMDRFGHSKSGNGPVGNTNPATKQTVSCYNRVISGPRPLSTK